MPNENCIFFTSCNWSKMTIKIYQFISRILSVFANTGDRFLNVFIYISVVSSEEMADNWKLPLLWSSSSKGVKMSDDEIEQVKLYLLEKLIIIKIWELLCNPIDIHWYNVRRLIGSLWANIKVIRSTEWSN